MMWKEGYNSGSIQGHVYPEVKDALERFRSSSIPVYIYSSGSVEAQQLLFQHSTSGNLIPLIAGHFDTNVGQKTDSGSYREISRQIGLSPADILFLTDVELEANAAQEAGFQVRLVVREGNAALSDEAVKRFSTIFSLNEITQLI